MLQLRTLMDEEDPTWNVAKEMFSRMGGSLATPPFAFPDTELSWGKGLGLTSGEWEQKVILGSVI